MNSPETVKIYAQNHLYSILTSEEIKNAFPENHSYFIERDWETACEYLLQFTDADGICQLELDAVLDGNTLNYAKNIAIFMLFTALMKSGAMRTLPPQISMQVIPYINARMSISAISMTKFKRMDDFVIKASNELLTVQGSDVSIDEIFERIFGYIPSIESYASVSEQDQGRYLPFFEMLYEKAQACTDSNYAEMVGKYIDALHSTAE